ncbi:hypothetical protein AB6N24_15060 [Cellulomonas sp. 179-A 4D5 NHS]|uniref:hypothetical protein n=1 Tax=Cellulomonas sp. 179-A 4D5 NHS TaxID=3142378 RepID=UPI0039A27B78
MSVLVPQLREEVAVASPMIATGLLLVGVVRHRPQHRGWLAMAVMLTFWAAAHVSVQVAETTTKVAEAFIGAGHMVAVGVVVMVWFSRRHTRSERADGLDVVIVTAVLALVAAQLVAAAAAGGGTWAAVVAPTVDVTIIGMLLRMAVTSRGLPPSTYLLLAAAGAALLYDLTNAVQGQRFALPGEPNQVIGTLCVLLFAVAALHPSMVSAFDPQTYSRRRPPSTALLGLGTAAGSVDTG